MDLKKFMIPWFDDIKPYSTEILRVVWKDPSIKRMMLNENPLPPSPKVVEAVTKAAKMGNRYPDDGVRLKEKIGKKYNLTKDHVLLGHGSSEFIELIMMLFITPGDEVLLPKPTFSLYHARALTSGGKIVEVDMLPETLQYDTEAMIKAITDKTKVIVICNPNNPTGDFIPDEDLIKILDQGIPTLIDEAYLEYQDQKESKAPLINQYKNAMISHTFSKAYGMAGIRFGYMLADPELIGYFRKIQMPWNVSILTLFAAEAAFDDQENLNYKAKYNREVIDYIVSELSKIDGVKPYHSYGNYVLVDATDAGVTGKEVVDYVFSRKKIMIKTAPALRGREGFFRLSIGTKEETKECIETIKEFFKEQNR